MSNDSKDPVNVPVEKDGKSDAFIKRILTSGTRNDQISAMAMIVMKDPATNMAHLQTLIGMARKPDRRVALLATKALREVFCTTLLPTDRELSSARICGWF